MYHYHKCWLIIKDTIILFLSKSYDNSSISYLDLNDSIIDSFNNDDL